MNTYLKIKSANLDKKLAEFINKTQEELNNFFEFKADEPLLFLVDSRKDLDLIWGKPTEKWFVGAVKNGNIYIFNPKVYAKESIHKKEEFWQILKHEYCHIYYTQITKSHYPVWLNEGLASYVSGKKLILKDDHRDKLLDLFSYFNKADSGVYMVGQFWVECLIEKFGKKKLIRLVKSFNDGMDERQFAVNFYKVYGFKFNKNSLLKFLK